MEKVRNIRPNQILTVEQLLELNPGDEIIYHHDNTTLCDEFINTYIFEGLNLARTSSCGWYPAIRYRNKNGFNPNKIQETCLSDCGVIPYQLEDGSVMWNDSNWLEKVEKPKAYTIEEAMEEHGVYAIHSPDGESYIITQDFLPPLYSSGSGHIISANKAMWAGKRCFYKTNKDYAITFYKKNDD